MQKRYVLLRGQEDHMQILIENKKKLLSLPDKLPEILRKKPLITLSSRSLYEKVQPYLYWGESFECEGEWIELELLEELAHDHGAILCEALGLAFPGMPFFHEQLKGMRLPSFLLKDRLNFQEEVVFFGGSFHPWHEGHQACLDLCPNSNIIIVPDQNPWKKVGEDKRCSWKSFLDICLRQKERDFSIYPGFWGMEQSNPTVGWLPKVKSQEKALLMGDDSFLSFHLWKDVANLLAALKQLYVAPRAVEETKLLAIQEKLLEINPHLEIIYLTHHEYEHLSSTDLRKK